MQINVVSIMLKLNLVTFLKLDFAQKVFIAIT